jgi:hypothetical protein
MIGVFVGNKNGINGRYFDADFFERRFEAGTLEARVNHDTRVVGL